MDFTYKAYEKLLNLLKQNNYEICNYGNYNAYNRGVILRHDVDFCLDAALRIAELEYKNQITSTYFILLSTSFYNNSDKKVHSIIREITDMGHDIGLHFDEARYRISNESELSYYVEKEANIMSQLLDMEIKSVSMHRPSKWVLDSDLHFDNIINSYSKEFFNDFKYISDSRMYWREDVKQVITSNQFDRLHILTHPIWYGDENGTMQERLKEFIQMQKYKCYGNMNDNIRDLAEILSVDDI